MAKERGAAAPDRGALQEAALAHLARYAATEAGLVRVLERRIQRWLRSSGEAPESAAAAFAAAREVARALAASGAVDDAAFAEARTRRLTRAGRSLRAVAADLAAKGVNAEVAAQALPQDELPAALMFLRRRRFGAFRAGEGGDRQRELAAMARAGFSREVAERALSTGRDEAERVLSAVKQG